MTSTIATVPLFIGTSGVPTQVPEDTKYLKEYLVQLNLSLQKDNYLLGNELKESKNQIVELEDENDEYNRNSDRLKKYVSNFNSLSEVYKSIVIKDREFLQNVKFNNNSSLNKLINVSTFVIMLISLMFPLYISIPLVCSCGALHYKNSDCYDNKNTDDVANLLAYHNHQQELIKNLVKTLDIINEFIDNGL
jgi:hypothetical protein